MASIGGLSVHGIASGFGQLSGRKTKLHERPGVSGHDTHDLGVRGRPFRLVAESSHASSADRLTRIAEYNNMTGLLVSVVDDLGDTGNNLLVEDVRVVKKWNPAAYTGSNAYWLRVEFSLIQIR